MTKVIPLPLPIPTQIVPDWDKWDWQDIIWRKVEKQLFNRKKRLYKAAKSGQRKKVHSLTKRLMRSSCAVLLGVRRVTQDNQGNGWNRWSKINKYLTPTQRKRLAEALIEIRSTKQW